MHMLLFHLTQKCLNTAKQRMLERLKVGKTGTLVNEGFEKLMNRMKDLEIPATSQCLLRKDQKNSKLPPLVNF